MSTALLLAEPEPATRGFLARHLAEDGFAVVGAARGTEEELAAMRPDVVLVGDDAALDAARSWSSEVPVIVLGPPGSPPDERVRAFERGCDDYVPRPFDYAELVARIHAVLRRRATIGERIEAGEVVVDRRTRRVSVAGARVILSGKEYELLLKLASDPDRVFPKEELLRDVWGFRSQGRTRTLDSHASRLRRKLGATGRGPFVVNVWGVGYRLLDA